MGRDAFNLERILEVEPGFLTEEHEHEHDDEIGSLSPVADRPMKPNRFASWIQDVTQRFGAEILRVKGIASIEDDDRQFVVQRVHMLIEGGSRRPWKEQEPHQTRLVFIGRGLYLKPQAAKPPKIPDRYLTSMPPQNTASAHRVRSMVAISHPAPNEFLPVIR